MAGKAKFDQESAFKTIIGVGKQMESDSAEKPSKEKGEKTDRVQRAYFLDRDIDKALRRKALEDEKNLTETINKLLRLGLKDFL